MMIQIFLIKTEVSKIRKTFTNGSPANIKFSKTKLSKVIQSGSSFIEPINPFRVADKIVNKAKNLFNKKVSLNHVTESANISRNILTTFLKNFGIAITLTNNEIKDIVKVLSL